MGLISLVHHNVRCESKIIHNFDGLSISLLSGLPHDSQQKQSHFLPFPHYVAKNKDQQWSNSRILRGSYQVLLYVVGDTSVNLFSAVNEYHAVSDASDDTS